MLAGSFGTGSVPDRICLLGDTASAPMRHEKPALRSLLCRLPQPFASLHAKDSWLQFVERRGAVLCARKAHFGEVFELGTSGRRVLENSKFLAQTGK